MHGDLDSRRRRRLAGAYAQAAAALGATAARSSSTSRATDYINSTGIALIVRLLAEARRDRREVRAVGLSDHYREIFRITRLSDFMTIEDAGDAAAQRRRRTHERATTVDVGRAPGRPASIRIDGEITAASEAAYGRLQPRADGRRRTIVLDFGGLEYMNSGGIGLLVTLLVRVQRAGPAAARRRASTSTTARSSSLTRLDEAIGIHDDEAPPSRRHRA